MALPRSSALRGSIRSFTFRRATTQPRQTLRGIGRRSYASDHGATKSSDLPWLIGSLVVTVPAAGWLWQQGPTKSDHGHGHDSHEKEEHKEEEAPEEESKEEEPKEEEPKEEEPKEESKDTEKDEEPKEDDKDKDEAQDDSKDEGKDEDKGESKDEGEEETSGKKKSKAGKDE